VKEKLLINACTMYVWKDCTAWCVDSTQGKLADGPIANRLPHWGRAAWRPRKPSTHGPLQRADDLPPISAMMCRLDTHSKGGAPALGKCSERDDRGGRQQQPSTPRPPLHHSKDHRWRLTSSVSTRHTEQASKRPQARYRGRVDDTARSRWHHPRFELHLEGP
jgi:hypothetical protein